MTNFEKFLKGEILFSVKTKDDFNALFHAFKSLDVDINNIDSWYGNEWDTYKENTIIEMEQLTYNNIHLVYASFNYYRNELKDLREIVEFQIPKIEEIQQSHIRPKQFDDSYVVKFRDGSIACLLHSTSLVSYNADTLSKFYTTKFKAGTSDIHNSYKDDLTNVYSNDFDIIAYKKFDNQVEAMCFVMSKEYDDIKWDWVRIINITKQQIAEKFNCNVQEINIID